MSQLSEEGRRRRHQCNYFSNISKPSIISRSFGGLVWRFGSSKAVACTNYKGNLLSLFKTYEKSLESLMSKYEIFDGHFYQSPL